HVLSHSCSAPHDFHAFPPRRSSDLVRCFCGTEYGMTWTCEQTDARLSDYLDGLLEPAEQTAFDHHVNGCGRCTPLVAGVSQVLTSLHRLEQVEPSPRLVNAILTVTQGPQTWRNAKRWLRGLQSPRFVYGAVSVCATIVLLPAA